jgi:gas vesicle protein
MNNGYEDEREMREERGGPTFGAFFAGLAIGAGLALLFAPQTGIDTRRNVRRGFRRARRAAENMAYDARERAEQIADATRERVADYAERARSRGRRIIDDVGERVDDAREAVSRGKRDVDDAMNAGRAAARNARTDIERRIAEASNEEATDNT